MCAAYVLHLKEDQTTLTNATVSKDSDLIFIMVVHEEINILNDRANLTTCLQNDIAVIYFVVDRSDLHFGFYSISGDRSDIYRFSNRKLTMTKCFFHFCLFSCKVFLHR